MTARRMRLEELRAHQRKMERRKNLVFVAVCLGIAAALIVFAMTGALA